MAEPTCEAVFLPRAGVDGATLIELMGIRPEVELALGRPEQERGRVSVYTSQRRGDRFGHHEADCRVFSGAEGS